MVPMYPRTGKVRSSSGTVNEYVRVVEAYREGGKVKQRVVADLGRKALLGDILPKLKRLLGATDGPEDDTPADPEIVDASTWGPILAIRAVFDQLGLWDILDRYLGHAKGVPFADRAFVLVANRLVAPASEHGLAGWLETDFVCDRKGRRFIPHWHQRRRVRVHPRQLDACGTAPSTSSSPPRTGSRWRCTAGSATSSVSSPSWSSTTSPAPTSRARARTTSPGTAT